MFAWSFSKLKDYEVCPYRLTLADAKTPRATNPFADAGIATHKAIETFLDSGDDPNAKVPSYPGFENDFHQLLAAGAKPELPLAVDKQWNPSAWETAWGRAILDAVLVTPNYVRIIDFKNGKPSPISHLDQAQIYALFAHTHYPSDEYIVEFWYLNNDRRSYFSFTPNQLSTTRKRITARALRAELDKKRLPRPNKHVCGYCPYINHCEYAPDDRTNPPSV